MRDHSRKPKLTEINAFLRIEIGSHPQLDAFYGSFYRTGEVIVFPDSKDDVITLLVEGRYLHNDQITQIMIFLLTSKA